MIGEQLNSFALLVELPKESRRQNLIEQMSLLEDNGMSCKSCSGMCCTFEFNSMLITPLEAIELALYLDSQNRFTNELLVNLDKNIKHYRLDKELFSQGKREFRRLYTCPFFEGKSLGCSISRSSKPYGCLAFNSYEKNVSTEGSCRSYSELLEKRLEDHKKEEDLLNRKIGSLLKIYWTKKPIPVALKEIYSSIIEFNEIKNDV